MKFIPSGRMCSSCQHWKEDCSELPFRSMPLMYIRNDPPEPVSVVVCSQWKFVDYQQTGVRGPKEVEEKPITIIRRER